MGVYFLRGLMFKTHECIVECAKSISLSSLSTRAIASTGNNLGKHKHYLLMFNTYERHLIMLMSSTDDKEIIEESNNASLLFRYNASMHSLFHGC